MKIDADLAQQDIDPQETREWKEALEEVIERDGPERAHYLIEALVDKARRSGAYLPYNATTAYLNTIPPHQEDKRPGDPALEGSWSCVISQISPTTGAVLAQRDDQATISVRASTLRIAFPDGRFDQGVFETPGQVVFRVCAPPPRDPRFHTVQGSATSRNEDLFGEGRIVGPNRIEVLLFRQTRAPASEQVQFQERYVLTRLAGAGRALTPSSPSGPG